MRKRIEKIRDLNALVDAAETPAETQETTEGKVTITMDLPT